MVASLDAHRQLIQGLLADGIQGQRVDRQLDTHISTVLLAGDFAYKIKKPVDFGFLDFSSLQKRQHFCTEELRLNRRLAPELYLEVLPIGGSVDEPLPGKLPAIEYAVKMARFDPELTLDRLSERKALLAAHVDGIAAQVALLHANADKAGVDSQWGTPQAVLRPMWQNFDQLQMDADRYPEQSALLHTLKAWTEIQANILQPVLSQRQQSAWVRECHGDLHLGNIALLNDQPVLFDGIEFNPEFIWIDVISDAAFLFMDLLKRGEDELAYRFLNAYLSHTGDYQGLALLPLYAVYRAMVRAKVTWLHAQQLDNPAPELLHQVGAYLRLAERLTRESAKGLVLMHGPSGSGKSYIAERLSECTGMVHLRADVERKRLYGLALHDRSGAQKGMYSPQAHQRTYDHLLSLADGLLSAGQTVVVDATFLNPGTREQFVGLAQAKRLPCIVVSCETPVEILRARVAKRGQENTDASDAGEDVLAGQLVNYQPLSEAGLLGAMLLKLNGEKPDLSFLCSELHKRLH